MMTSLPGLGVWLGSLLTIGLGVVGVPLHVTVAALWGRGRPNALATTVGPAVCAAIGVAAAVLGSDSNRAMQSQLDDAFLMIPAVGVIAWSLTSLALWAIVRG